MSTGTYAVTSRRRSHNHLVLLGLFGILLISTWPGAVLNWAGVETGHGWIATAVGLSQKIGEALLVAAILGVFVDDAVKRAMVAEVLKDVLSFAVGYTVPSEIQKHIVHILRLPFVRRGMTIRYDFEEISGAEGQPSQMKVKSTTSYNLYNLTGRSFLYTLRSSIVKRSHAGFPTNELLGIAAPTLGVDLAGPALKEKTSEKGPYSVATVAVEIPPNVPVPIVTQRIAYHRIEDSIFLDLLEPPGIGLRLEVAAPAQYQFNAQFGAPGEPLTHQQLGHWTWQHDGVHLPGGHVHISWSVSNPAAATPEKELSQQKTSGHN
jgi:hypothetical protein